MVSGAWSSSEAFTGAKDKDKKLVPGRSSSALESETIGGTAVLARDREGGAAARPAGGQGGAAGIQTMATNNQRRVTVFKAGRKLGPSHTPKER